MERSYGPDRAGRETGSGSGHSARQRQRSHPEKPPITLNMPPGCLPNSADVFEVLTLTSCTASGFGNCSALLRNDPVLSLPSR